MFEKIKKFKINGQNVCSIDFIRNNWKSAFIGFFVFALYQSVINDFQQWVDSKIGTWLDYILCLINDNYIVSLSITISIIYISYQLCKKVLSNSYYSLFLLIYSIVLILMLIELPNWVFAQTAFVIIDFKILLIICMITIDLCDLRRLFKDNQLRNLKQKKHLNAFTNDVPEILKDGSVRKLYANKIINQLLNTDISEESYSVGITGSWGSGKTSFLKTIYNNMEDKAYKVIFNPWACQNSQILINDFFNTLNDSLKNIYSPLEKNILNYSRRLTSFKIHPFIDSIMSYISDRQTATLKGLQENIQKGLLHVDKPICVFIDDIDRLEKNELLEVLKIVRNTAKFRNLIYIIAFDEKYVIEQLQGVDISDGALYLEKIFPLKIALPKMDEFEIYDNFTRELRKMAINTPYINSMLGHLSPIDKQEINYYITTFRKAKHFARQFSVSANFLIETIGVDKINLRDLLLLELTRYADEEIYNLLSSHPEAILRREYLTIQHRLYYVFSNNLASIKEAVGEHLSNKIRKPIMNTLLSNLFPQMEKLKNDRLQLENNYLNYFCLGIPTNIVSQVEFNSILNSAALLFVNSASV